MRLPSGTELAVAAATCGGVLALGAASGGFYPLSWNLGALVAVWIGLLASLAGGAGGPGRSGLALLAAIVVLTAWTALSALWSDSVPATFDDAERDLLYVAVVAAALALGRRLTLGAVSAGVVAAVSGICVWNLLTRWGQSFGREANPIGYGNGLALLGAVALVLAAGLALEHRPAALLAVLPIAPVLVLSRSNGAWAALLGGAIVLALLRSRLSTATVLGGAALVALAFAAAAVLLARGHERGVYWPVALHEIAARPALGSGAGTYGQWFLRLRSEPLQTADAHSLYLETLAELGPAGLAATLALLALPLAAALRLRRRPLAAAAGAAVAVYALGAAVDFHWELTAVTVPVLCVAAALARAVDRPRPGRSFARLPLAAGLAALGAAAALSYAGNAPLAAAGDALAQGRFRAAAAEASKARRLLPWSAEPWLQLGEARLRLGDRAGARAAFERATARDPNEWILWLRLAEASTGEPRRRALARAARLNPLYFAASG